MNILIASDYLNRIFNQDYYFNSNILYWNFHFKILFSLKIITIQGFNKFIIIDFKNVVNSIHQINYLITIITFISC